MAKIEFVFMGP